MSDGIVQGQHAYERPGWTDAVVQLAHLKVGDAQLFKQPPSICPLRIAPRLHVQGFRQEANRFIGFSKAEVVCRDGDVSADEP